MRGRDIKRYGFDFADLWLINTHNGIKDKGIPPVDINNYPAVKAHLDLYWDKISVRNDKGDTPYNLRNCVYTDDFSKQKILWGEISDIPKFMFDRDGQYCISNKAFLLTGEKLHQLLAFLNSSLCQYYFSKIATTTGEGTVQWLKYKVELIPIPEFKQDSEIQILNHINALIQEGYDASIDKAIDDLIFGLYPFTEEEITYIRSCVKK